MGRSPKTAVGKTGAQSGRFRTTPIKDSIARVKQLPSSAILYKCEASQFWQFRVFLDGAQRKRSTKTTDLTAAQRQAKLIYADMLQSIHGSEQGKLKLSGKRTLQGVAASLWDKQAAMIAQGELNPQKNKNEQWVFSKHIQPFFKDYDLKDINADTLEQFKLYLFKQKLAKSTQKGYFSLLGKLFEEAVKKQYIHQAPILPNIRVDDEPRGYFNAEEYTKLWQTAKKLSKEIIPIYREQDYDDDEPKAGAKPYRKIKISWECYELILFMRNTYVRPTDIKVIKHKHIKFIKRDKLEFLELTQPATKRHNRVMVSTEYAPDHYRKMCDARLAQSYGQPDDYVFMPQHENREYALKEITRQFEVILRYAKLKTDANGKNRTLYSLRHTAIVTGIRDGISEQTLALNARTSVDMIDRFYGSHVKSVLSRGTEVTDKIQAKQERYAAIAKEREGQRKQKQVKKRENSHDEK